VLAVGRVMVKFAFAVIGDRVYSLAVRRGEMVSGWPM
jgi:hypothetical protein